jgi:hypothetical protein
VAAFSFAFGGVGGGDKIIKRSVAATPAGGWGLKKSIIFAVVKYKENESILYIKNNKSGL